MMTFAGHDAGPRGTAIENDFLSTLSVMRSPHGGRNSEESAARRFLDAGAFLGTNPQLTLTVATNTEYSSKPKCVRAPVALGVCSSWFDV
jgi:hypothetical protein